MHILAIAGYTMLCLLALIWLLGVRVQLGCGDNNIIVSAYYSACAIALPISGVSLLHSWWMIPAGYCIGGLSVVCLQIPAVRLVLFLVAFVYATIIRLGVDPYKIAEARLTTKMETKQAAIDQFTRKYGLDQGLE